MGTWNQWNLLSAEPITCFIIGFHWLKLKSFWKMRKTLTEIMLDKSPKRAVCIYWTAKKKPVTVYKRNLHHQQTRMSEFHQIVRFLQDNFSPTHQEPDWRRRPILISQAASKSWHVCDRAPACKHTHMHTRPGRYVYGFIHTRIHKHTYQYLNMQLLFIQYLFIIIHTQANTHKK